MQQACQEEEEGKNLLFLKKKKQKDFYSFALVIGVGCLAKRIKIFWFFFSKKNILTFRRVGINYHAGLPRQR